MKVSFYLGFMITYYVAVYMILYWLSMPEYAAIKAIIVNLLHGIGYIVAGGLVYIGLSKKISSTVYLCILIFVISHFILRLLYTIYIYADTDRSGVDIFMASIEVTLISFVIFVPLVIGLGLLGRFLARRIGGERRIRGVE